VETFHIQSFNYRFKRSEPLNTKEQADGETLLSKMRAAAASLKSLDKYLLSD